MNSRAGGSGGAKRFRQGENEGAVEVTGSSLGMVARSEEYRFHLYRHWTLYDSMKYSNYIAAKLRAWDSQTNKQLEVSIYCYHDFYCRFIHLFFMYFN